VRLRVVYGSQNKSPLFTYAELTDWFLGAFAKLRKAIISFVMSVCPSAGMEQLSSVGREADASQSSSAVVKTM
jgi:hypothetical protein